MTRWIVTLSLFVTACYGFASENIRAKVIYAGVTGGGAVFVHLTTAIDEAGCSGNSLWVDSSSPVRDQVLSTALTAYASKSDVYVKASGCYYGNPTLSADNASWFHLFPAGT